MTNIDPRQNRDLLVMIMALGDAYLEKGLYAEAAKRFNQLLEFNAAGKQVYLKLSKALIGLKNFGPEALAVYQKAVELDPNDENLCGILAGAFLAEKREDREAIQIYEATLNFDVPFYEKITSFLMEHYDAKGEHQKCKSICEALLTKNGFQLKALNHFLSACWQLGEFQAAINLLKRLIDTTENDTLLLEKLCATYLEKRFRSAGSKEPIRFSYIDKQMAIEYLQRITHFEKLRDLGFYLELKSFVLDPALWGPAEQIEAEQQQVHAYQPAAVETEAQRLGRRPALSGFDLSREILTRMSPKTDFMAGPESPRSSITFDDFKKEGSALFASAGEREQRQVPQGSEIIITIELCDANGPQEATEPRPETDARHKFWLILKDFLEQYEYRDIWTLSNGLIVLCADIVKAVSFCTDVLNKVNYYNALNDNTEKIHLAMGVHHSNNLENLHSTQTLNDFLTATKLATVGESDLSKEDHAMYGKVLRKADRIFLSPRAYREVKSANRFKVHSLGKFRLKYLSEPQSLHEVSWRNPVNELRFGYVTQLGRFELLTEIGGNAAIKVYKAKDADLQRFVILKIVQSEVFNSLPASSPQKTEFYRIARTPSQFSHPNIAKIYDVDEDHGLTFIAREFIEGTSLTDVFRNNFSLERFVKIIYRIFKGLHYIHRVGICHHNLKPSNILVGEKDETRIMDFQIPASLIFGSHAPRLDQDFFYAAPEQIHGHPGDARSDIFAMGLIMYEAVTQAHPFVDRDYGSVADTILKKKPEPPSSISSEVPSFFNALILKCLEKEPEQRFQTSEHIVTLLKKNFERTLFSNFNYQIAQSRDSA